MRVTALLLVAALLVSTSPITLHLPTHADGLTPHDPIIIVGNEDLTPENGVVGGSGTPDDPYVIDGWSIMATGEMGPIYDAAIILYNVSGYILLRNLELYHHYDDWWYGVGLYVDAPDAHIIVEDTVFRELNKGMLVVAASLEVKNTTFLHILAGIKLGSPALNEANISGNTFIDVRYGVRITEMNQGNVTVRDNMFYMPPDSPTIMEYAVKSVESRNIHIAGNTVLCYSLMGIRIHTSDNLTIEDNHIGWNESCAPSRVFDTYGVFLHNSSNIIVKGNTLENIMVYGIYAYNITNLTIQDNTIYNTSITYSEMYRELGAVPIFVNISRNIVVEANNVTLSEEYGIRILGSAQATIKSNTVAQTNKAGIDIYSTSNILLQYNIIAQNSVGLHLNQTTDTTILYNSFIDNNLQAGIEPGETAAWDDGSKGNYWSDYQGTDTDGDYIGDQPYVIDELNKDNHPLLPHAEITDIQATANQNGTTTLTIHIHIHQPPGTWTITASTPQGAQATTTITITQIPHNTTATLTLPTSEHYTITLTDPANQTTTTTSTTGGQDQHHENNQEESQTNTTANNQQNNETNQSQGELTQQTEDTGNAKVGILAVAAILLSLLALTIYRVKLKH